MAYGWATGRVRHRQVAVVHHRGADEHADRFAAQAGRRDTGVLERLPGQLQRHPLLRVDVVGFGLGQREELRVEALDVAEVAAAGAGLLDRLGQPRFLHELRPAALGQVGDRVATLQQRLPGLVGGVHIAGQPGGQAHHGDVDALDRSLAGPVGVVIGGGVEFGVALDDPGGQRFDRRVLERGRDRHGDPGVVFDVGGHRHRIARGQTQFDHGCRLVDRVGRTAGGVADPLAQPLPHLGDGHVGASRAGSSAGGSSADGSEARGLSQSCPRSVRLGRGRSSGPRYRCAGCRRCRRRGWRGGRSCRWRCGAPIRP